ncbi:MAG: hypothetical protein NTW96_00015 [Planctomycetia bacterium]|nr:hypothetical protein [Planctomycetia bacterium]
MEQRFAVRKREMLAECEVSPRVFDRMEERLRRFVEPFVENWGPRARREHAEKYVAGEDARSWFADGDQPPTRGAKVWEGKNLLAEWLGASVRLFASGWTNPHAEKKVARIDYLAAGAQAAPFCLAITIEEPVSP